MTDDRDGPWMYGYGRHPSARAQHEAHLLSIEESQWCDDCKLPSIMLLRYAIVAKRDPTRWLYIQIMRACRDCGITTEALEHC